MNQSDKLGKLLFREESSGTHKMFSLYESLKDVLQVGGVVFIDELDARLHPLLVRNIIQTFINPDINKNNAQLIFTTHDMCQFDSNVLRRDEIWLVEKNHHGESKLFSLADFVNGEGVKVRKDEAFTKNYLSGTYGAIPKLKELDMLINKTNNKDV